MRVDVIVRDRDGKRVDGWKTAVPPQVDERLDHPRPDGRAVVVVRTTFGKRYGRNYAIAEAMRLEDLEFT